VIVSLFAVISILIRKGKHASIATNHLDEIVGYFAKIDPILGDLVVQSKPIDTADSTSRMNSSSANKRKINSDESTDASPKKKANVGTNGSMTLSQREKRAMELLASYLEERGGMFPLSLASSLLSLECLISCNEYFDQNL
jgi:hypothetical protein